MHLDNISAEVTLTGAGLVSAALLVAFAWWLRRVRRVTVVTTVELVLAASVALAAWLA